MPPAKPRTDQALFRIIDDGLPSKGMPAFHDLGDENIRAILDHLHFLQGRTALTVASGNPAQGQQLFFGKGRCGDCHAMSGRGHFISRDLTDFAADHDANEIREAILNPSGRGKPRRTAATVTTDGGQRFSGVILN